MTDRTPGQKKANQMDMDIYRMIVWAEREALEFHPGSPRGKLWSKAASAMKSARPHLRSLMHEEDQKGTVG